MTLSPVANRVELLDILRGFAIFGMFTVNLTADIRWADLFSELQPDSADFWSLVFVNLFTNGKFITIFSFLFGVGFYVQTERRIAAGGNVPSFWLRRLSGLMIIGLAANALTLPAWILVDYSLFGLGLLLFFRMSPRNILIAAIACFVIPPLYFSVLGPAIYPVDPTLPVVPTVVDAIHDSIPMVYGEGSFLETSALTLLHMWEEMTDWKYFIGDLSILGLMLLGLYVGRCGAVWDRDTQVALARKSLPWLLAVGFLGCAVWVAMENFGLGDESSALHEIANALIPWPIGMPILGLGYVAAITIIIDNEKWRRWLELFAPIGRMALTNYLFTALVSALIMFHWGLGLYGQIFPAAGLLIVVALLPAQMIASRWWLTRFGFGPFEWLWRSWTYGKLQSMKR